MPIIIDKNTYKTIQEIEQFLLEQFPKVSFLTNKNAIEEKIRDLKSNEWSLQGQIEDLKNSLIQFEEEIDSSNITLSTLINKKNEIIDELHGIKNDLESIKKADIKHLLKDKEEDILINQTNLSAQTVDLAEKISTINNSIDEINIKKTETIKEIAIKEGLLENIRKDVKSHEDKLSEHINREEFFNQELVSLEFLFKFLLKKELVSNYGRYDKLISLDHSEYEKTLSPFLKTANQFPDNWRSILSEVVSFPIPKISGVKLVEIKKYDNKESHWEEIKCSVSNYLRKEIDTSSDILTSFLALKTALKHNDYIVSDSNDIIISLSSGIFAQINFRKKGINIQAFQQKPLEIFIKHSLTHLRNSESEYSEYFYSSLLNFGISVPYGYYIFTDNYIIEISFSTSPFLFSNNIGIVCSAISENERKIREEEEEEEERKREDDE